MFTKNQIAYNKTSMVTLLQWCEEHNIEFLDTEYVSNNFKHTWKCNIHNEIHIAVWDKIKTRGELKCCSRERLQQQKLDRVQEFCNQYNVTLVGSYKDGQTPTQWKCNIHNEIYTSTRQLMEHTRGKLPCCRAGKHGNTLEDINIFATNHNWVFLDEKYLGSGVKHNWYCNVHKQTNLTTYSILNRGSKLKCCDMESRMGPNHPGYNKNVSDDQRIKDRRSSENKKWRYSVVKRDNFTCQKCFKTITDTKLNAHHVYSYLDNPHLRYETSNGFTLCVKCHAEFHKQFGKSANNLQQLLEFVN